MFNQKTLLTTALVWVPISIVFTGAALLAYAIGQQNIRQSLNDPQIQVVEQAVAMIAAGQTPQALVPSERIDPSLSLSPFIIFYDEAGKAVVGSGVLNGATPAPPAGVFTYTKAHGEDRLTWRPKRGVRIATIVKKTSNGYVLAGRSMREGEDRISKLGAMAAVTLLLGLGLSLAATLGIAHLIERKNT